ncbi:50S ribosomal protein L3 N(5)-glutamine methyltransferase [Lampropedia puyangensis]|uniref:50S ribosomal protein L3 N(5)-glutamine methyltransferase n=1 Tax=Lampropedia puyangensis TaxID=1330072 RepID=A0A4S8F4Y4_9BURK|nr:50S ribosomal protein L3 N(5)-glutamine methyltransferase [Lampropedia puyangensis]THU02490.1 50S ribosomal protein L3 N(5)-glutamine methyltransferase [Lampropedia puyangensis]
MSSTTPITLRQSIATAAAELETANVAFGHGTDNAYDEAAWLVLWALQLPLDSDLEGNTGDTLLDSTQLQRIADLTHKRITLRKPAAYLTQEAWLYGVPFYIDERSIVPRSLIAGPIADGTLDHWLSDRTHRVLDICTGNGSLAILAALAWPEVQVDAVDISSDALDVARINIEKHDLVQRIRLIESNSLNALSPQDQYDLVLCNPPYVNSASMAALPQEYLAEPALALAGGADGMDFIRPLLQQLPQHMTEEAIVVLEIGNERGYFEQSFPQLNPIWLDTNGNHDAVLVLTKKDLLLI